MVGMAWYPMTTYREGAISFSCLKAREALQKPRKVTKWSGPHNRSFGLSLRAVSVPHSARRQVGRWVLRPLSRLILQHPTRVSRDLNLQQKVREPTVLPTYVSLVGCNAGWRRRGSSLWSTEGLQTGLKRAHKSGICFVPAAGSTRRSFIGNKDFLTIKNPVTDTFSALSSIKVLKIWALDSR